eukprot:CAMPEP_0202864250 /NCGR_PEP_ID=MMETSP1391-20130828/4572_1 /ASSEMBLY_ACC=CAM_ASM_000867 /TAXON_ID=1034604 /ORGANISM="Chlamydomonas leiostraca, Strain SAG 11-49" /LENGTH=174 /DNA_ID=CAMNT_0049543979 /DNA_START=53 /DNA_END=577 /DNA_ORIENTATION=-
MLGWLRLMQVAASVTAKPGRPGACSLSMTAGNSIVFTATLRPRQLPSYTAPHDPFPSSLPSTTLSASSALSLSATLATVSMCVDSCEFRMSVSNDSPIVDAPPATPLLTAAATASLSRAWDPIAPICTCCSTAMLRAVLDTVGSELPAPVEGTSVSAVLAFALSSCWLLLSGLM